MKWLLLLLFGGLGLAAAIGGVMWGLKRQPLARGGVRTKGQVVGQEESVSSTSGRSRHGRSRSARSYTPIVEFMDGQGVKHRFTGSTGGQGKPIIETGAAVEVIYDPADPSNAQIASFSQFRLGPLTLAVVGGVFLLMGVGGFFLMGSHDRGMQESFEMMDRERLIFDQDARQVQGTVVRSEERPAGSGRYVFVCRARRHGSMPEEEFLSDYFTFDPGRRYAGWRVTIYLDPANDGRYHVDLRELLPEVMRDRKRSQ